MLGIDRALDRGGEHHATAFLKGDIGGRPVGIVGCKIGAGNGHETAARSEARQRRRDMTKRSVCHAGYDISHCGERRIHQDDSRCHRRIEMIVNLGCIEARDGNGRKQRSKECGAGLGEFVEHDCAIGKLRKDREQAGAGRRFENAIGGGNGGGSHRDKAQRDRRRELLERLHLFGPAGVGRKKGRDFCEQRQARYPRTGLAEQRLAVLSQEQDGRDLAGFVGRLPGPGAGCIGGAKGLLHRSAQDRRVDALAPFEVREQEVRGREDRGSCLDVADGR